MNQVPTPQVNQQALASVKRMENMLKGASDPQKAMSMLASQNPQIGTLMNMAKGQGSMKNLFFSKAKEMGVDPNTILSQL